MAFQAHPLPKLAGLERQEARILPDSPGMATPGKPAINTQMASSLRIPDGSSLKSTSAVMKALKKPASAS